MKTALKHKNQAPARRGKAAVAPEPERYVLRLVIAGTSRRSTDAIANLTAICEKYLPGRYDLEIIDIYQQPELAESLQVVAAPTLLKQMPPPLRRLVGDLSQAKRILFALDLPGEHLEACLNRG